MQQTIAPTPTDKITVQQAASAHLAQLGHSADAVADRFRALGIKGVPQSDFNCPVAIYLGRLDGIVEADVLETRAYLYPRGEALAVVIALPDPVQQFVHSFDRGVHLDLVHQGAELVMSR